MEEIFLSFEFIKTWVNTDTKYTELLEYVGVSIRNREDYFRVPSRIKDQFSEILSRCKKAKNREQFAAQLLLEVTSKNSGFKVLKNSLGECWINNCCETAKNVLEHSSKITEYRHMCGIHDDELTAMDKLKMLDDHSIFSSSKLKLQDLVIYI